MPKNILLMMALFFVTAPSAFAVDCPALIDSATGAHLHQRRDEKGICTIEVSSLTPKYPHREFVWNSEGRMMSSVDFKNATGAHTYYIVPVESNLKLANDPHKSDRYEIKASEQEWSIDKQTSALALPKGCSGSVAPASQKNHGGLEIKTCENKLIVDVGWKLGGSSDLFRAGQSTIRDPQGKSCVVKNKDVYKYQPGEEPSPQFVTSQEWFDFLKSQPGCKNLNIDFLKPRLPANQSANNSSTKDLGK